MTPPEVIQHEGVFVVRDDRFPGGTKARFLPLLFDGANEVVYASAAEGGAQTALATVAAQLGKRATIFVAKRAQPHPRALMAKRLGARIMQVTPGYLSTVQARARDYCRQPGVRLAPFGVDMPEAIEAIASAARATGIEPDEVWCASGSGVLARGLAKAWPKARRHVVQVGRALSPADVAGASIHVYPVPFGREGRAKPPFPSDPHYDAKAWEYCAARKGQGRVLFWNVAGPAEP
ncbi:MAG: pyridoxal-phosphate dependent enzyme [Hyphomicrobiales bacterium]|nr:pyridoxal-phosphate dependent enzyme [Hyphomicrobiales bacterium]